MSMTPVDPPTPAMFREITQGRTLLDIANRFTYHPPKDGQAQRYTILRNQAHDFANRIVLLCPDSRERATALTHLDSAVMFANAAIARNE